MPHRTSQFATSLLVFAVAVTARAASPEPYNIVWHSPSGDCHGSMPLGNGSTGVNAWINPAGELEFYISRTDSWGDNARLLKVGKVRLTLEPAPPLKPFEQTLSLVDATMVARYGEGDDALTLKLWVDANHPVIQVTVDAPRSVTATVAIELWRTERFELPSLECSDVMTDRSKPDNKHAPTIVEPDTVLANLGNRIGWYHRNVKSVGPAEHSEIQGMTGYQREDPLLHRTFGAVITADAAKRIDDTHLQSPAGKEHHFSIHVDTLHPATEAEWLALMDQHAKDTESAGFAARREAHERWWRERWNRSWIMAEESEKLPEKSFGGTAIPVNKHAFRIGMDQAGKNQMAGQFGRVSVIGRALTAEQVAVLAKCPHGTALGQDPDALFTDAEASVGPIKDSVGWNVRGGLTLEAWIQPTQNGAGGGRILDKITPGVNDGILLDTHSGLRLLTDKQTLTVPCELPADRWFHVAAVIPSGGSSCGLYVDGRLRAGTSECPENDEARLVSRAYALQRFIDLCAGRGAYPIKFNGSIFTVPHQGKPGNADYRRWGPGYWWQNTRLPYISMCASGDTDMMAPLFRMYIDELLPLNLFRTQHYFGHGGAYYIECVHFWGDVFNECYGWTPYDKREDKLQEAGWHKWEWVAGPELVYMALDYYQHTSDADFLKQKALPTADAVIAFFDEHYKLDANGKLVMHPSQALETWWDTTNPMPEVAGLRAIVTRLLALDESLTTPEQRAFWTTFRRKLPELPTRQIEGEAAFAPAERFAAKRNCENAELYCVFPFRLASFNRPNAESALRALEHRWDRGNAGWRQDDIFMAYLGLRDQARSALVGRAKNHDRGSRFSAFWGPNYDWIPDQDHGGVLMKAFQAMLMQAEPAAGSEYDGKIYLLPAWPKNWNVQFKLHAPGHTIVEGEYRDGKMVELKVTPPARRDDVVVIND